MKRYLIPACSIITMLSSVAAWSHGGPEELGHHWAVPTYTNEIHFQIAVMAFITCGVLVGSLIMRRMKNRSSRQ